MPGTRNSAIRHPAVARRWLKDQVAEGAALVLTRVALAGVFWRSGRAKIEEGSWLTISDTTFYQFAEPPFSNVPVLPPEIAAYAATLAEHLFPVLLVLGLMTRLSAFALLAMTLVIQFFVFPEAWWQVHLLWTAMAAILIARGAGMFSMDATTARYFRC